MEKKARTEPRARHLLANRALRPTGKLLDLASET